MGDPKKKRKLYEKPKKLWDAKRIEEEKKLREEFGLKNARELWRMQTILRKIRREARRLLSRKGKNIEERAEKLLKRVKKFLINKPDATLDDILALSTRDILARRLQSIVLKKNLAKTAKQARQFIVHGHIAINGSKVTSPSYLTSFSEEQHVNWFKKPIFNANASSSNTANGSNGGERAVQQTLESTLESTTASTSASTSASNRASSARVEPESTRVTSKSRESSSSEPVENAVAS